METNWCGIFTKQGFGNHTAGKEGGESNSSPAQLNSKRIHPLQFQSELINTWQNTKLEQVVLCQGQGEIRLHSTVQEGRPVALHCGRDGNWVRTTSELFRVKLCSWGGNGSFFRAASHVPATNNVLQAWPEQSHARAHGLWSNEIINSMKPRVAPEGLAPQASALRSPDSMGEWCITSTLPHKESILPSGHRGRQEHLLPSVLILRAVLTSAKRVALKVTVPSLFRGMFMHTRRCTAYQQL